MKREEYIFYLNHISTEDENEQKAIQIALQQPEVIYCKECRYRGRFSNCPMVNSEGVRYEQDDDFCSYAERKK